MQNEPTADVAASTGNTMEPLEGRRQEERIMQVSRLAMVGEMASGIAHELNQPLTAISNYAQACENILRSADDSKAEMLGALREIDREARRAGSIIRRLRDLTRAQPVERARADINGVVRDLAELMQGDARAHEVRLRLELQDELPAVVVDRTQIQHVLLNLVRNALDAMDGAAAAEREIVVRTARVHGGDIELAVSDTGPGLAPQVANRLFTPFVTTKPHGTGLGLVSSQTILRAHEGTLGHRPNSPRGACFFIRLPAAE
jgi:C4-dicarboxylate-specific signal transduction histidine kinase